jgi:hypothetical protein
MNLSVVLTMDTQDINGRHPKVKFTNDSFRMGKISPDAFCRQRGQVSLEQSCGEVRSGDCYLRSCMDGHKTYFVSDPSLGI